MSYKSAMASEYDTEWLEAMKTQVTKITDAKSFKLVDRPSNSNTHVLPGKWVYALKSNAEG